MKNLFLGLTITMLMLSCKKESINETDEINQTIPTIKFNGSTSENINECGTCGTHIEIGAMIPTSPTHSSCSHLFLSICSMTPINNFTSTTQSPEGFNARFENRKNHLVMIVEKLSLTEKNRKEYFKDNQIKFDKPVYMNEVVLRSLNLKMPYLIEAKSYEIIAEDANEMIIRL